MCIRGCLNKYISTATLPKQKFTKIPFSALEYMYIKYVSMVLISVTKN